MRNMVYAFDADDRRAAPFWQVNLGPPMPYDRIPKDGGALLGQYNIRPYIGVTSTPVIDRERECHLRSGQDRRAAVSRGGGGHGRCPVVLSHSLTRSGHRQRWPIKPTSGFR